LVSAHQLSDFSFVSFLLALALAHSTKAADVPPEEILFKQISVLSSQIVRKEELEGAEGKQEKDEKR
jgi:hypothetical protein